MSERAERSINAKRASLVANIKSNDFPEFASKKRRKRKIGK